MSEDLRGKRIAFLTADEGVEQVELTQPWEAVKQAGGEAELITPNGGEVHAFNHLDRGDTFSADTTVDQANGDDYDGLVLPGGVANPDILRNHRAAVDFVRSFFDAGKPVAAICHGPWTLVEADVVRGRTLTSWPSLQTDIRNAGGTWVDEQVHVDQGLVTSRKPDDLDYFCAEAIREFAAARHERRRQATAGAAGTAR